MSKRHAPARVKAVADLIRAGMLPAKNGVNTVVIEDEGRRVFTVVLVRGIALGEDIQTLAENHEADLKGAMMCRYCGCTEDHACPGGCSWIAEDCCSHPACMAREKERRP